MTNPTIAERRPESRKTSKHSPETRMELVDDIVNQMEDMSEICRARVKFE
jgi:hypothetical protein